MTLLHFSRVSDICGTEESNIRYQVSTSTKKIFIELCASACNVDDTGRLRGQVAGFVRCFESVIGETVRILLKGDFLSLSSIYWTRPFAGRLKSNKNL